MDELPKISVRRKVYEGRICLFLFFESNEEIVGYLQCISPVWSRTYATWYLIEDSFSLHELFTLFDGSAIVDITDLEPIESFMPLSAYAPTVFKISMEKRNEDQESINEQKKYAIEGFVIYLRSLGYRSSTIRNYKYQLQNFLFECKLCVDDITEKEINDHIYMMIQTIPYSSTIGQFKRSASLFLDFWKKRIYFVNAREYHKKERKYLPFLSREILMAICSYALLVEMN